MSIILSVVLASSSLGVAVVNDDKGGKADSKDELICKRFPPPVGTRLRGRKICATKQQWAEQEQARDTAMDNLQNRTGCEEGKPPC